jgi:catechol 2,3-dioxygenase-like lactoylglutathione lyase family enzyme
MRVSHLESLILFVCDLAAAKAFYVGALGLPVLFEDQIVAVVGGESGRVVLHRNDRGCSSVLPSAANSESVIWAIRPRPVLLISPATFAYPFESV